MSDGIIKFPTTEKLTTEQKLEVWASLIQTEPWEPEFVRTFLSHTQDMDLTEADMAKHPPVLRFWREIKSSFERWQAEKVVPLKPKPPEG